MNVHISKWVEIPAGSFLMGGIPEDKFVSAVELPRREVQIRKPFALGVYPVTCREWLEIMGGDLSASELPVTAVDFESIHCFLAHLSELSAKPFRLPSEAEWEYACRAGSATIFPEGHALAADQANFLYDESGLEIGHGGTVPVGRYPANAFGLHDMLGNVCEWTTDTWHTDFHRAPADETPWLHDGQHNRRVIRGGAWDHLPRVLRASWRDWAPENARWDNLGFRVAFTL